MHRDTAPMVNDREFFRRWGFELEIDTFTADILLEENPAAILPRFARRNLSSCRGIVPAASASTSPRKARWSAGMFCSARDRALDLPGGDRDLLLEGIRQKLLPLPDATIVLPGHGPSTTIGWEKQNNPVFSRLKQSLLDREG